MENGDLVEHVAADMIRQFGASAATVCREKASIDDERGDMLSAEAWRDIADAAERQLRQKH
jgi:hypothetical protein